MKVNEESSRRETVRVLFGYALQARLNRSTAWASGLIEIKHNRAASLKNLGGKLAGAEHGNRCRAFLLSGPHHLSESEVELTTLVW